MLPDAAKTTICSTMQQLGLIDNQAFTARSLDYTGYLFGNQDINFGKIPSIDRVIEDNKENEEFETGMFRFKVTLTPRQYGLLERIANHSNLATAEALAFSVRAFCHDYKLQQTLGESWDRNSELSPYLSQKLRKCFRKVSG